MSKYYLSQNKVEEVREAADIVDTIGEYIPIKKRGKNYTGLCPFHSEKKPSFTVSPSKQLYHCFGCGASGNVITFVMKYESVSFIEAIEILGKKYGIKLDKGISKTENKIIQILLDINDFAQGFFREELFKQSGKNCFLYLKDRGINKQTIEEFGIGYAPDGWDNFLRAAKNKGFSTERLLESGLIVKNEKGNVYDRFRNRVVFTFYNGIGKKIGFAGRTLGDEMPKYLNISETALYRKRFTLYGIYQAKEDIRKLDVCLVVEGYMDMLTLFQAGFKNVVAISGTSLTDDQAKLIRKYTRNVLVSFDADKPGKEATLRGISTFIKNGLTPYILTLETGKDPDEIVKKQGIETFKSIVEKAEHFVDFKTKYLIEKYDLEKPVEKAKVIRELKKTLSEVTEPTEKQIWLSKVSKVLAVDESLFLRYEKQSLETEHFTPSVLSLEDLCHDLIAYTALFPERYEKVTAFFRKEELFDDTTRKMSTFIEKKIKEEKEINIADIIIFVENEDERRRLSSTIFNVSEEKLRKIIEQYLIRIRKLRLRGKWKEIREKIKKNEGNTQAIRSLLQEQKMIAVKLKNLGGDIGSEKRV